MEVRTGCSGWSYQAWKGPFYPRDARMGDYLGLYSRVFDTVEIDSTFYATPPEARVLSWKRATPDGFRFCPKMPRQITHEGNLAGVDEELELFTRRMKLLGNKLGTVLIQFPPSFTYRRGYEDLSSFLPSLPDDIDFAMEFRDESWFRKEVLDGLGDHDVAMAWADTPFMCRHTETTSRNAYLRLVGDRSIPEERFSSIQKDQDTAIEYWRKAVDDRKDDIERIYIFANNHFQGFSPGTVNLVRERFGMEKLNWDPVKGIDSGKGQTTLF